MRPNIKMTTGTASTLLLGPSSMRRQADRVVTEQEIPRQGVVRILSGDVHGGGYCHGSRLEGMENMRAGVFLSSLLWCAELVKDERFGKYGSLSSFIE